ncbi:MAG TPA: histidine kinase [Thermoanaerobaculia bacterium]|nr:histidine kinase [Thermoanaerobaculia bacterium]
MLLAWLLVTSLSATAMPPQEPVRMHAGHDPAWASPAFDDSSWPLLSLWEVPYTNDSVWLRRTIELGPRDNPVHPVGVFFGAMASHELWWDGELIGRGGVVGRTKAEEVPGPIESHYQVPDRLAAPGRHTIAVRASAFHRGFSPANGYWTLMTGDYDRIATIGTRYAYQALVAWSAILLTAVFAFAMFWIARRDRSFLLLGALCLSAAALLVAEAWRPLFGYTYDWHIVRLRAVVALSWLTSVLLVALMAARFPHRRGPFLVGAAAVVAAVIPFIPRSWDPKSLYLFMFCFGLATAWTAWAAFRRMHGGALALIGVGGATAVLFASPWRWADQTLFFALDFLFVCLLCSHALEVRRERAEKARLELEVVKRHMQPHFLMNTLTALSEWIEEEPRTAVRMIESLADELRILSGMTARTLVTAEDELRLCRSHLATMSLRRDVRYELEVEGVDQRRLVPPAMFHTLIENAITHGAGSGPSVRMRLAAREEGDRTRYIFEAPASGDGDEGEERGGGTRYIQARLREAWGERWSFRQGLEGLGTQGTIWRTEIVVPSV